MGFLSEVKRGGDEGGICYLHSSQDVSLSSSILQKYSFAVCQGRGGGGGGGRRKRNYHIFAWKAATTTSEGGDSQEEKTLRRKTLSPRQQEAERRLRKRTGERCMGGRKATLKLGVRGKRRKLPDACCV